MFFIFPLFAQNRISDEDRDALDQLVSDLMKSSENEKIQQQKKSEKQAVKPQKTEKGKKQEVKSEKRNSSKKIIVIDPGHGGTDPGAVFEKRGKGGKTLYEKDIALKLSKKIEKLSKNYKNLEVILTRNKDVELDSNKQRDLGKRAKIANKVEADLFISIHVNANPRSDIGGMEIYHLDNTRDEYADKLARVENKITGNTSVLDKILVDMTMNYYVGDSLVYAKEIGSGLKKDLKKYDVKIRSYEKGALFYVLIGARMPSLLFEIGYITNETDRGLLEKDEYLEAVAKSLLDSIASSKVEKTK